MVLSIKERKRVQYLFLRILGKAYADYNDARSIDDELEAPLPLDSEKVQASIRELRGRLNTIEMDDDVKACVLGLFPPATRLQSFSCVGSWTVEFMERLLFPLFFANFFKDSQFFKTSCDRRFVEHVDTFVFVYYERRRIPGKLPLNLLLCMWNCEMLLKQVEMEKELVYKELYDDIPAWVDIKNYAELDLL